jgi:hypothetical protein
MPATPAKAKSNHCMGLVETISDRWSVLIDTKFSIDAIRDRSPMHGGFEMIKTAENGRSRCAAVLGALAFTAALAAGCSTELPTESAKQTTNDDCYYINGQWICPHEN